MPAKGYCTFADVENLLGETFTEKQQVQCDSLIEAAEKYLDEKTNRAWLTGAQTDEAHYIEGQNIFLKYVPITSVEDLTGRAGLGESETSLTVDVDYEVRDLNSGHIVLENPGDYDRILVDYTPVATVPADIKQATIEIVAARLQPTLRPGMFGVDSYSLPDLTVRFARSHVQQAVPPYAQEVIDNNRYTVHA